jgi:hypothetical protein
MRHTCSGRLQQVCYMISSMSRRVDSEPRLVGVERSNEPPSHSARARFSQLQAKTVSSAAQADGEAARHGCGSVSAVPRSNGNPRSGGAMGTGPRTGAQQQGPRRV